MKKLIAIADWADDSLGRQEFKSSVEGFLKDPSGGNLNFVCSSPSTVNAAFISSQIIETEEMYGRPLETIVFLNVDPRLQAQGAPFFVIKLKSGIYLCGPNAGYNFSLIKRKIDELFIYRGFDKGSQFRSRDLYARICAHLIDEMEDELELEEIATSVIPNLAGYYIGHIDNFGNIKTTISLSQFKGKYEYGDIVRIKIHEIEKKAHFVNNLFSGGVGELVIYPGSSGPKDNPYLEISIWRYFTEEKPTTGSAEFNTPRPGMEIAIVV